ncbi:MAG: hypothetical protein RL885_18100 [Planctomycetota bacterium]
MTSDHLASRAAARSFLFSFIFIAAAPFLTLAAVAQGPELTLHDVLLEPTDAIVAGESWIVSLDGLEPGVAYELSLLDGSGALHGYLRLASDDQGHLGPEILWYQSGITGSDPAGDGLPGPGFQDLASAEAFLLSTSWSLELSRVGEDRAADLVGRFAIPVKPARTAFPCDARGRFRTSFEAGREPIYLAASGLPKGERFEAWTVADRDHWRVGDLLEDVSGWQGGSSVERFTASGEAVQIVGPIWPAPMQRPGRFDFVLREVTAVAAEPRLRRADRPGYSLEAAIVLREPSAPSIAASREIDIAGRQLGSYPHFEHLPAFLRSVPVAGAVDPADLRSAAPRDAAVFRWAAFHVVDDRSAAEWATNQALVDVTEVVEVRPIKAGTLEVTAGPIWTSPDPATRGPNRYDVVVDLGASRLGGPPQFDDQYTPGIDLIDGADREGFILVDDPSQPGPYAVGRTSYNFEDAVKLQYGAFADNNTDIRAVVAYPADADGEDVPVVSNDERFPLVVILHGNHAICNVGTGCSNNCAPASRIPNHEGYDYLLDLWASHGFIAVSVDGFDVTCKNNRYLERGALIIEHLQRWRKWNLPYFIDPVFGGRFRQRVQIQNIAVIGHSRGGEGAVAAEILNDAVGLGWNIRCVGAIAPTDQNTSNPPGGVPRKFVLGDVPLFNMMGSSDGDVINMQGARLFDRAAPAGREADKSQVFIYGANHNSWNTVWIDPNWRFGGDDGVGVDRISAEQQQLTGKVFLTSWIKAWCQGELEMLEFHRNRLNVPSLGDVRYYWSYESSQHVDVDDFQNGPADPTSNSLGGAVTALPAPEDFLESSFRAGAFDGSFFHDTDGLIIGWRQDTLYSTVLPQGSQDLSPYTHVALRIAVMHDNDKNPVLAAQRFGLNLVDTQGRAQRLEIDSEAFDPVPYPYPHPRTSWKTMLSSVRVPLRAFRQNNSELDLTQIQKIEITLPDTGLVAIDDIQFTR